MCSIQLSLLYVSTSVHGGEANPVAVHTEIFLQLLFSVYDEIEYNWFSVSVSMMELSTTGVEGIYYIHAVLLGCLYYIHCQVYYVYTYKTGLHKQTQA